MVAYLSENLPDDAVIANGAGNYAVWVHRFYRYRQARTQLAPTNGAMGYGLPAAIAASLRDPQRSVVCFAGDGCFMMYPQELATAAQFGATPVVIVVNNGMLGTIRMHQEREYPGRVSATRLTTLTSSPWREPSAPTPNEWSAAPTSPPRSAAPAKADARRCWSC